MELWGGRFKNRINKEFNDFNSSLHFDMRLYSQDIKGSIAHAAMLGKTGIISPEEADILQKELSGILNGIEEGKIDLLSTGCEDIHSAIEKLLAEKAGDTGRKLHTGRSRNDQVALDMRMYVKDEIAHIKQQLASLMNILVKLASTSVDVVMPGYTHMQRAQPVLLAHHFMAYFQMFKRDLSRLDDCYKRSDEMPLGSGALSGTPFALDRHMVAEILGFSAITENSLDAVSDRDFCIEFLACLSIIMVHLGRFCEELVLWSSSEFSFIEIDDSYSTGSSMMPQKKNPDAAELIRGKGGRVFGHLTALLSVMKSLPLSYNKDMQEDKEAVFDSVDTVEMCLPVFTGMISTMRIKDVAMRKAACESLTNATDLADYLAEKGIPFRKAHEITGKIVLYCLDNGKSIEGLTLDEYRNFSDVFAGDVYKKINLEECISARSLPGGTAKKTVLKAVKNAQRYLTQENLT